MLDDNELKEWELRIRLITVATEIVRHARDDDRDLGTAIEQARQTLGLMLAEWQAMHPAARLQAAL